ncbi:hypothetical protein [Ruminococcus sp.]
MQLTAVLSKAIRTAFPNGSLRHRPRIFIFLFYDRLPALQKMLLLALPFPQRQGFFLCSGGGSTAGTVPPSAEKAMRLSALQCNSFRVSKFAIQTKKQDFF